MVAQTLGSKNGKPGLRQDEYGADDQGDQGSGEEDLPDRIALHQPFRRRAGGGEHECGTIHVKDGEWNVIAPRAFVRRGGGARLPQAGLRAVLH